MAKITYFQNGSVFLEMSLYEAATLPKFAFRIITKNDSPQSFRETHWFSKLYYLIPLQDVQEFYRLAQTHQDDLRGWRRIFWG